MRSITGIERAMERWATAAWSALRKPQPKPAEVVAVLRRECDDNAMIVARGRTLVPNHFTIELPEESHRQLAAHSKRLEPELAAQVRRYAAEQRYHFTGPVTVDLHSRDEPERTRYRVRSRIAPCRTPASTVDRTQALPAVLSPEQRRQR